MKTLGYALTTCLAFILAWHPVYSLSTCFLSDMDLYPSLTEVILGISGEPVILVKGLEPGSSAELIGLETGDLIVGFKYRSMRFYRHFFPFYQALSSALRNDYPLMVRSYDKGTDSSLRKNDPLRILRYNKEADRYFPHQLELDIEVPNGAPPGISGVLCYFVMDIKPGGAAQRLGLEAGDFLEQVDGHPFTSAGQLDRLLDAAERTPDRRISLVLTRWFPVGDGTLERKYTCRLEGHLPVAAKSPRPLAAKSLAELLQARRDAGSPHLRYR